MTTENNKPAVVKITPIQEVRRTLEGTEMKAEIQKALTGTGIPADKFIRIAITAVQNNPALLSPEVDRKSLYGACMKAAQDGLLPDNREAALVLFKDKVQYMPMVAGILKKVRNSGELSSITSQVVHKGDKFRYWVDSDGEHLEHEPLLFGERGDAIGVYALAKTKDGAVYIEVMDIEQVRAVRNMARSKNVWDGAFGFEMWKKSAIRRLSKRLPMSTDLEQVIHQDDELYDTKGEDHPPAEPQTKPTRLSKIIEAQASQVTEVEDAQVVNNEEIPI